MHQRAVTGGRLTEDRAATLSLISDDSTHCGVEIERCLATGVFVDCQVLSKFKLGAVSKVCEPWQRLEQ